MLDVFLIFLWIALVVYVVLASYRAGHESGRMMAARYRDALFALLLDVPGATEQAVVELKNREKEWRYIYGDSKKTVPPPPPPPKKT